MVGEQIGAAFADLHREHGVDLRLGVGVAGVMGGGGVESVQLTDGSSLPAETVVVGVGVKPNVELAEAAGLELADHGVAVNAALQSSDPDIYAVGDIAAHDHPRYDHRVRVEHWAWAKDQGAHVAGNLMGGDDPYELRPFFFSDQYDLGCEYRGLADPARDELVLRGDLSSREFTAFWLRAGGVVAAMNVNQWTTATPSRPWSTPAAHCKTDRYPTATVVPTKELQMSASLTSTAPVPAASVWPHRP